MYENLLAEIGRHRLSKKYIAEYLEITTSALRLKLNGVNQFTLKEAFKIRKLFDDELSIEYLFTTGSLQ